MLALVVGLALGAQERVELPGGRYQPLLAEGGGPIYVAAYALAVWPVTQAEYAAFVQDHPEWRRDRVSPLFADGGYLRSWSGPGAPGPHLDPRAPVTELSWHAARAYCADQGGRLPLEAEWELALTLPGGQADPALTQALMRWYSSPTPALLPPVGGARSPRGLGNLVGLIWEWVEDYSSTIITTDNRAAEGSDAQLFCGGGALGARDPEDYATFMRAAFRSSLRADTTVRNLGFRCAWDLP